MLVGIIHLALGMKKVLTYVAGPEHHDLRDALPGIPLVAAAALLLLLPVGAQLPAVAALGVLLVVLAVLIGYEAVVLAPERDGVRHAGH